MTNTSSRRAPRRVRARFLQLLGWTGSVRASAVAAGAARSSLYKWRAEMPDFAAAWDRALGIGGGG